jgi:hypothetical protein
MASEPDVATCSTWSMDGGPMAVTADLAKLLDKAYEDKTLAELVHAPVSALSGVSKGDAKLLAEAFNIKTIGDLGRNKFFRAATALVDLAGTAK